MAEHAVFVLGGLGVGPGVAGVEGVEQVAADLEAKVEQVVAGEGVELADNTSELFRNGELGPGVGPLGLGGRGSRFSTV